MAQVLVLYNTPADSAAFDRHYHEVHIPLAKKLPGLRSYVINNGPIAFISGEPPYLVAQLTFDSMSDIRAAIASPEGKTAAADLPNFAGAGVTLLLVEFKEV